MPYISKEQVKQKREALKKAFPDFKLSITSDYSEIRVAIMEAPFNLMEGVNQNYESVNPYYIAENYKDNPKKMEVLLKIRDIINSGNGTEVEDGDYGTVPKFYISIMVGKWDKPFKVSGKLPPLTDKQIQAMNNEQMKVNTEILSIMGFM